MAEGNGGVGGGLYFIVGALCVVVAVGAFFLFGGNLSGGGANQAKSIDVKIETPKK
jgi:hypothetical protein